MKKLIFFLLLLASVPLIWNCNSNQDAKSNANARPMPCVKHPVKGVISIADFALQSMIQNSNSKKLDTAWLRKVSALRDMDRGLHAQLDTSCCQPIRYYALMSCCACGSGCCRACDTIASTKMFMSTMQVRALSIVSTSEKKTTTLNSTMVGDLKLFNVETPLADGKYLLEFETPLLNPPKVIIPILVEGKKMILDHEPGH